MSDFDLKTILMQIYPEVKTRKILLVGHSQGAFYTNELYKYLTTHGVPPESIAVYNIATPASYVAGGGKYITSTNDKVIDLIRDKEISGNVGVHVNSYYTLGSVVASALRANVSIPKENGWEENFWGGHGFGIYMNGATDRIVNDVRSELAQLKAVDNGSDTCFDPPEATIGYRMQAAALNAVDAQGDLIGRAIGAAGNQASFGVASAVVLALDTRGILAGTRGALASLLKGEPKAQGAAVALAVQQPSAPQQPPRAPSLAPTQRTAMTVAQVPQTPPQAIPEPIAPPVAVQPQESQTQTPIVPTFMPSLIPLQATPGFGGGGVVASAPSVPSPTAVSLSVSSPDDGSIFSTTTISFAGVTVSGATVTAAIDGSISTTTADGAGNWTFLLALPEGSSSVSFFATGSSGTDSATVSRTVMVDTIAPATTTLAAEECSKSIAVFGCVIPASSATLSWSPVGDAAYFGVMQDGSIVATTTATVLSRAATYDATTSFAIVSYDGAGNSATSSAVDVFAVSRPLIINEVGWAGDGSNTSNQWIELKNLSSFSLDLTNLELQRSGGSAISLSGTLGVSNPYLVVEPVDISFTGSQKLITPFAALSTSGEQLSLVWNGSFIDSTPDVSACGGWCSGNANARLGRNESGLSDLMSPLSMERISDVSDGSLAASWHDTDSYGPWRGTGGGLWGTPGIANSSGLPEAGVYCGSPSDLITEDGPYDTGSSGCVYLTKFVTGNTNGAVRYGGLYQGSVGSSTVVNSHSFGKALAGSGSDSVPSATAAGERFFFAMWEVRSWANDVYDFNQYFTVGSSSTAPLSAPHGNYVTIPFTYQP